MQQSEGKLSQPKPISIGSHWKYVKIAFSLFLAVIAVLGFIYAFAPKISVVPNFTMNPQNPFLSTFILSNDGRLPIYSVEYSSAIIEMKDVGGNYMKNVGIGYKTSRISVLDSGERQTIRLGGSIMPVKPPVLQATGEIIVKYRPSFYFKTITQSFRFMFVVNERGEISWLPIAPHGPY